MHRVSWKFLNKIKKNQTPVDMQSLFKRLTLDTFGEVGLGVHLNTLNKQVQFSQDFDWVISELEHRFINPYRPFMEYEYSKRLQRMDKYIADIIAERRTMALEGKFDLLSMLIQTEEDPKFLRDNLMNFIIAGRDTTAILLSWTIYYLSNHPEVRAKVCAEIETHLGSNQPTFDNIKNLKYLDHVLHEVLRLNPPALPISAKQAIKSDILPNGVKVNAKQCVIFSPYVLHRLYWGEDAEQFKPERWDDPISKDTPYAYIPFQRGPRQCLGMNMAFEEAAVVLVIILQSKLNFQVLPGETITHCLGIPILYTLKNGLNVQVL